MIFGVALICSYVWHMYTNLLRQMIEWREKKTLSQNSRRRGLQFNEESSYIVGKRVITQPTASTQLRVLRQTIEPPINPLSLQWLMKLLIEGLRKEEETEQANWKSHSHNMQWYTKSSSATLILPDPSFSLSWWPHVKVWFSMPIDTQKHPRESQETLC